ncbi:hypothetical protein ACFLXT_00740 [Chloroflexota bacterium]
MTSGQNYTFVYNNPRMGIRHKLLEFPVSFSDTPGSIRASAPEFGQHTEETLRQVCGYGWDNIKQMTERG